MFDYEQFDWLLGHSDQSSIISINQIYGNTQSQQKCHQNLLSSDLSLNIAVMAMWCWAIFTSVWHLIFVSMHCGTTCIYLGYILFGAFHGIAFHTYCLIFANPNSLDLLLYRLHWVSLNFVFEHFHENMYISIWSLSSPSPSYPRAHSVEVRASIGKLRHGISVR